MVATALPLTNSQPLLLYDGDCPLCIQVVRKLERFGLLKDIEAKAWQESSLQDDTLAKRIRTEFLLMESNQVRGGFEAMAYLVTRRIPWLKGLFILLKLSGLGAGTYKLISMNRRVIAPAGSVACVCDPPFHPGYRAALCTILLLITFIGSALFGASLGPLHPDKSSFETAWQFTLAASSGWTLNFPVFGMVLPRRYREFVQQCLVVMSIGSFWLMPIALINALGTWMHLSSDILLKLTVIGVGLDSLLMFRSWHGRSARLKFPNWVPWLWFLLLQSAGVLLFVHFGLFH